MSVAAVDRSLTGDPTTPEGMPQGLLFSGILHLVALILVILGLPTLFHRPPLEDQPIAVELVTIAPETRATHPNPYRPKAEAKPDAPVAPPAPKPIPKPPQPAATPPPSASAPPPAPEPQPQPPTPEANAPPPPPPPPPKPVEAQAPPPPPPRPPEPKPKPEPRQTVNVPKPDAKKTDVAAFDALLKNLNNQKHEKPQPAAFDSLLKNLTHEQTAQTEDAPPQQRRQPVSASAPSSQPKAPLGSQLTASEMDILRDQLDHCWNVPVGVRDAKDLVVQIRVSVGPDATAQQATIVDQDRLGDPVFRAAAESARRAFFNPQCIPLKLPPDKYDTWKDLVVTFSPKDIL